jgi:hypothetical protein
MISKWLHINELGGDPWVLPIWGAIINAVERGDCNPVDPEINELGIYISTRLNMLPRIIQRIKSGWHTLYSEIKSYDEKYVFSTGKEGFALPVNDNVKFQLLIDIDSFLFETNSCSELMTEFFFRLLRHRNIPCKKDKAGDKIKIILTENGQNPDWFVLLDKERNFFIHNAAPYIAIDISREPPDLLIMKENIKDFSDPKKFTKLSELDQIVKGFWEAKNILQKHLIQIYLEENAQPAN